MAALEPHNDTFGAAQRSCRNPHALARGQKLPRLRMKTSLDDMLDGFDVFVGDCHRSSIVADDPNHSRCGHEPVPDRASEPTEDVAATQGPLDSPAAIGPAMFLRIAR